ncbi:peptidoglycan-binding protein [Streptomyces sp. RFCAC02]|uniref:peptidoglycan-binding protein n=1 Tax=Streptomyces sp. RFCAC02 TaxID=2499143 RepID=UPI001F0F4A1D|nr:peptidoglycan-binding protein [Streptomyces sp. RFCAC02]
MSTTSPADARSLPEGASETDTTDDAQPVRRRRLRTAGLALGVLVLTAAGTGAGYWLSGDDAGAAPNDTAGPAATAEVTRETLAATESFDGVLGHGAPHTVAAAAAGTLTGIAGADTAVERGTELFRVDEQPVTALLGALPMFRDLRVGDIGTDVEQLEDNLSRLGYDGFTVDDEFTTTTEDAVRAWQEDIGAEETGFVSASSVVFLPSDTRVDSLHADVGDRLTPGASVLDVTGSGQTVSLDVALADRELLAVDTEVAVELPDGTTVPGTVTASDIVTSAAGPDGSGGETVAETEVELSEAVDEALLGMPLDVIVRTDERTDVLAVPVGALLALSDGGYGLEVVAADGTSEVVEVETGLFADGKVEVSGGGVAEGTVVGMAGR